MDRNSDLHPPARLCAQTRAGLPLEAQIHLPLDIHGSEKSSQKAVGIIGPELQEKAVELGEKQGLKACTRSVPIGMQFDAGPQVVRRDAYEAGTTDDVKRTSLRITLDRRDVVACDGLGSRLELELKWRSDLARNTAGETERGSACRRPIVTDATTAFLVFGEASDQCQG